MIRAIKSRLDLVNATAPQTNPGIADHPHDFIHPAVFITELFVQRVFSGPAEPRHRLVHDDSSNFVTNVGFPKIASRQERDAHSAEKIAVADASARWQKCDGVLPALDGKPEPGKFDFADADSLDAGQRS